MSRRTKEAEARAEAERLRSDLDDAHERLRQKRSDEEFKRAVVNFDAQVPRMDEFSDPRSEYQVAILRDFQTASKANTEAIKCLAHAQQVAAQAALALVEARKQVRRISEGVV